MSPGPRISPSSQNAVMCFSPSPSMSKQSRETKCFSRSTACAGQISPPLHRLTAMPSSRTARLSQTGQWSGNSIRRRVGRAAVEHDPDDLRDHVAGALHDDRIADPHVLAADLVLVVQGRALHDDAADRHRFEHRGRGQRALASDRDHDAAHHGLRLLGGEFMRQRPARRAAAHAEPGLQREIVELVDDAVDVVGQFGAACGHLLVIGQHLGDPAAQTRMLVDREPPFAGSAPSASLVRARKRPARLAPGIGEEFQRPARRDAGVELAQRAGRDIARVHEKRLAGGGALLVDREKPGPLHVHFAAHFERCPASPCRRARAGTVFRVRIFAVTSSPVTPSPRVAPSTSRPPS